MERKWLLLFKGDVVPLSRTVQKMLFEHYITEIHDLEELSLLDDNAIRHVAAAVFWEASKLRFREMTEAQIAEKLREMAKSQASRLIPSGQMLTRRSPSDALPLMLSVWSGLYLKLQARSRLLKRLFLLRTASILTVVLVMGGLLFGIVAPVISDGVTTALSISNTKRADLSAGPLHIKPVQMIEWKAGEQQNQRAADIKMTKPAYLPSGYAFQEGMAWQNEGETETDHFILTYTNEEKYLLRVTYYKLHKNGALTSGSFMPAESTDEVLIRGTKALLTTYKNRFVRLDWTEEDAFISITGREIDTGELVKMAKSLN
jgi:hypothetical protein